MLHQYIENETLQPPLKQEVISCWSITKNLGCQLHWLRFFSKFPSFYGRQMNFFVPYGSSPTQETANTLDGLGFRSGREVRIGGGGGQQTALSCLEDEVEGSARGQRQGKRGGSGKEEEAGGGGGIGGRGAARGRRRRQGSSCRVGADVDGSVKEDKKGSGAATAT